MSGPTAETTDIEFADIDRHFGDFIARFGGDTDVVARVGALLSRAVRLGHICLDVSKTVDPNRSLPDHWREKVSQSPAFGGPATGAPVVLTDKRLFLRRYWEYEQLLAQSVGIRASRNDADHTESGTQEAAIAGALRNYFTVISGGPGTGKTTTVLTVLRRFIEEKVAGSRPRIALAAPTGKAAARIQELLRSVHENGKLKPEVRKFIPQTASTIHRLLGSKPDSVFFRHDQHNPLPVDLVVVDEASMVPLPLMAKLFDALPPNARVILLGDQDQLASVEPGAVLADIADACAVRGGRLRNALFVLTKNFRFGNENAIYQLSNAVRRGEGEKVTRILAKKDAPELQGNSLPSVAQLAQHLGQALLTSYQSYFSAKHPATALQVFSHFRVLCAVREGPFGVNRVNEAIESVLHERGLISDPSESYAGQPVLITRNDYQAQLFNGDIGVILPDPSETNSKQLWAWFIGADNQPRRLSLGRLPDYELAYAMTVHKAQGSQFEQVLFLLPDRDSPVLTRELVYTAVTRASQRVDVWFNEGILGEVIKRKAQRHSGLVEALLQGTTKSTD
jgi:exodeoxyribonuclease V alpha subunit